MVGKRTTPKRRGTTHVETLHGEVCIHEWTTRTVHALNPAAARVVHTQGANAAANGSITPSW